MIAPKEQLIDNDLIAAWEQLGEAQAVRQFQTAFTVATGLPLTLLPAGLSSASPEGGHREGFCVHGCLGPKSGKFCLGTLQGAETRATQSREPVRFRCPAGLIKLIVPVHIQGRHAGNVLAGPFAVEKLNSKRLGKLISGLKVIGLEDQKKNLEVSWRYSPVVSEQKVGAALTLVNLFCHFLSETGNRILIEAAAKQSPLLQKIDVFLAQFSDEEISLEQVAQRVNLSPCHFCKTFKKQTGLTFTEYRMRKRVEQARVLLLDPHTRISEAAFKAGFNSLPYFNRVFRRVVGCSPTEFRKRRS